MEDNPHVHLAESELVRLLEKYGHNSDQTTYRLFVESDIHPHLALCPSCRAQFHELSLLDRRLKSLRTAEPAPIKSDCPTATVWREIAGGLTPPDKTLASVEHASRCDHCGPLLRRAVADLADLHGEVTDAERQYIASLESANPEWQQQLARRITGNSASNCRHGAKSLWSTWFVPGHFPVRTRNLAFAGASLFTFVIFGLWAVLQLDQNRQQPAAAEKLVARAYTEKRTLELRIAGAEYAPLRISRGPAASFISRPAALLKAEALIASQLENHPSDASWLRAQAQADLLEGKYDAAVEALRRALELSPHSPSILTDLATAHFQRALQEERKDDFGAAYEYLSQSLKLQPDDPVALFNRALVAERQALYHQSLDDWDRYLQLDPNSPWATEARESADRVRVRLKEHEASQAIPLLSPSQIIAAASNPSLHSTVDARIEEYLSVSVRSWLPQAFPVKGAASPATQQALFFLADLTRQQHNDNWLSDFLRSSAAPNFPYAVAALAKATQANDSGSYASSLAQASAAELLFRSFGSQAGILSAQFEQVFATQIERHSEACQKLASAALAASEKHSYSWLEIQLGLEKGVCSGLMGDIGSDERNASRAMNRALQAHYGSLYLRASLFAADDKRVTGDPTGASSVESLALDRFWSGQFPALRGYNLYAGLAEMAEAAGWPNLQVAVWREALSLIDRDPDLLLRAIAHRSLAQAATAAHLPQLARSEYDQASVCFKTAPPTDATRNDALETLIRTARLEASVGRFDDAIARLSAVQDQVRGLSNNFLVQMFYSTLGEIQLGNHHGGEAEQALKPALVIAEQNLTSLRTDAERASWSKDAAPAYLALVEAQLAQGRPQEAFETFEWYLAAPQRSRSFTASAPSGPAELNPILSLTQQTVLAYAALPHGLAIWTYDDRGLNSRWIPQPMENLQDLTNEFYSLSSDPRSEMSVLRQHARTLYEKLVLPVEAWLSPQRTLVIESDSWLSRIPFEVLLDKNDRYLIERAPIVHSLGQESSARLHSDAPLNSDTPALIVGSSASSQAHELVPIPDITFETDLVAARFRSSRVLTGTTVNLANVQNALPAAVIFHFAGHSLTSAGRSGLLLENGTGLVHPLTLLEAGSLRRGSLQKLNLAVLSACSTASNPENSIEFNSVTYGLLRAGVPHVVASRWAVDSVATRGFVKDFYTAALAGQSVPEALRQATVHSLGDPRTAHPYYWSAFSAYGRP